jgi:hypothetical protein
MSKAGDSIKRGLEQAVGYARGDANPAEFRVHGSIAAADWIASQPKSVQDAGEARGLELIREAQQRKPRRTPRSKSPP